MIADIVVGLGYGDEGKGMVTNYLCSTRPEFNNKIVVRFGGGNQVGHTVVTDNLTHVHHHTGSGTLSGVPTYYSEYTTVDPIGTIREIEYLEAKANIKVSQYYHPKAMIVTPWDVLYNHERERKNSHGSVGVGFGATIQRNKDNVHLYVMDCGNAWHAKRRIEAVRDYYLQKGLKEEVDIDMFSGWLLDFISKIYVTKLEYLTIASYLPHHLIFEGHQGALLDMEYGVFPHVTHSKTTPLNAFKILKNLKEAGHKVPESTNVYQLTRAYATRHGNGPFFKMSAKLKNTEKETNTHNKHQGEFRTAPFNEDLFVAGRNAVASDIMGLSSPNLDVKTVVTCLDQVQQPKYPLKTILSYVKKSDVLVSDNPKSELSTLQLYEKLSKTVL